MWRLLHAFNVHYWLYSADGRQRECFFCDKVQEKVLVGAAGFVTEGWRDIK